MTIRSNERYAAILGQVHRAPQCAQQIAAAIGVPVFCVRQILRQMADLGLVHVGDRLGIGETQHRSQVWYPGRRVGPRVSGTPLAAGPQIVAFASILQHLRAPISQTQLMAATGITRESVATALKALRAAGLVRIGDWVERRHANGGGPPTALLVLEPGPDEPRPKPMSPGVLNKRHWASRIARADAARMTRAICGPLEMAAQ